jgi:hypothetical protein
VDSAKTEPPSEAKFRPGATGLRSWNAALKRRRTPECPRGVPAQKKQQHPKSFRMVKVKLAFE